MYRRLLMSGIALALVASSAFSSGTSDATGDEVKKISPGKCG